MAKKLNGWIGVDLDSTLAEYHGWDGGKIGKPIPAMLERVKRWLSLGIEVRIMTARVGGGSAVAVMQQRDAIEDWCVHHLGQALPVTCTKDFRMLCLWDDRAVSVEDNTGRPLAPDRHIFALMGEAGLDRTETEGEVKDENE